MQHFLTRDLDVRDAIRDVTKGPSAPVTAYLMAYNLASFMGWGYVLYKTATHYAAGGNPADMYAQSGELTKWVQTGALLEIVHAAIGFVRSPVGTTATQVFSRIMLVWGVMHLFPQPSVGIFVGVRVIRPWKQRGKDAFYWRRSEGEKRSKSSIIERKRRLELICWVES